MMSRMKDEVTNLIKGDYEYDRAPYDSEKGVKRLATWYNVFKEREFIAFLSRKGMPFGGVVLEVGGARECMVR